MLTQIIQLNDFMLRLFWSKSPREKQGWILALETNWKDNFFSNCYHESKIKSLTFVPFKDGAIDTKATSVEKRRYVCLQ